MVYALTERQRPQAIRQKSDESLTCGVALSVSCTVVVAEDFAEGSEARNV